MTSNKRKMVLSLKNDYCFKAVYGSDNEDSKKILIALLNEILDRKDNPIVDLEYKNPFQAKIYLDEKESILDIKAVANSKEIIDIEMQIVWDKDMEKRLLYYAGGMIREALNPGADYSKLKPTITICITNSIIYKDTDQYINNFYYMEEETYIKLSDKSRICCIELPKVNRERKPVEELSMLEICLEYLKCADETDSEYLAELIRAGGEELQMAQEKFVKVTQDEILREQALAREKFQRDKLSMQRQVEEAERNLKDAERHAEEAERNLKDAERHAEEAERNLKDAERHAEEAERHAQEAERHAQEAEQQLKETERRIKQASLKLKEKGLTDEDIEEILGE